MTAFAVEIIEKAGIKTSDPFFRLSDFIAISKAAVPLETATPYFLLLNSENFFQISLRRNPQMKSNLYLKYDYKFFLI